MNKQVWMVLSLVLSYEGTFSEEDVVQLGIAIGMVV